MTATTTTRPRLRDHLHVGLRVINTTSLEVFRIQNLWRADHQVQLVAHGTGDRFTVTEADLSSHYAMVQPFRGAR
jgi:hypothetical protein